jgi:TRAP transporter TAXI family solute receptor
MQRIADVTRRVVIALIGAMPALHASLAPAATPNAAQRAARDAARATVPQYKIVTASERGTYIQIGRDLARFIAPLAGIKLDVLPSAGSAENVRRLRYEPGVKLAMVQSDVYQAFLDQAAAGNVEAGNVIRPLRVITPLYNEEIYFVVRADSPMEFVHDIRGARINTGPIGSGTALTTTTLYRLMFDAPILDQDASFLSNEEALAKLVTDKSVDVVAIIAGQPAKVLTDMKPESRQFIKLLKVDPDNPATRAALGTYFPATVRAANYPNLLSIDMQALAVRAYLVTYDFNLGATKQHLVRLMRELCRNFSVLEASGHPKWREVSLSLPDLGRGWAYYDATAREIRACAATRSAPASLPKACSQQERVLGLCG